MELLRLRRGPVRSSFTKTANALQEILSKPKQDNDDIATLVAQLNEKWAKLKTVDECIIKFMEDDTETYKTEIYEKEYATIEEYSDKFISLNIKAARLLAVLELNDDTRSINSNSEDKQMSKRKYKLPEIELKRFSGEAKEWLGFWGLFKKINDDADIDPEDKYQYLMQATVEGSKARDIVQSFPPTAESYAQAIEYLKIRFGRDDVLVEVYVRELLRLVLNNAMSPLHKMGLFKLYDQIETHLRALETLGVTTDKYAAMLYPLVEACLPVDVLRIWERSLTMTMGDENKKVNKLEYLMKFLRCEVEGEERINMVREGFGFEQTRRKLTTKLVPSKDIPTAAGLLSNLQRYEKPKQTSKCIFCENKHFTQECKLAGKIPYEEKRDIIMKNGCCFSCLKPGHVSRFCKSYVRCKKCSKKHYIIMCPELNESDSRKDLNRQDAPTKEHTLANKSCTQEVLMQTLTIRLRGKDEDRLARCLIDTGSQHSYITKSAIKEMRYESIGEEVMNHSLFGGVESTQTHKRYRIYLSSLNRDYRCNFQVYDQETICAKVPRIKNGAWMKELKSYGIFLSDCETKYSTTHENSSDIQLLIGADVAGKLLTGKRIQLPCGLTALDTHLGWTLMGKIPNEEEVKDTSLLVLSLHVNEAKLTDLWNLDSLGILDPAEKQTKQELEEQALKHFRSTVRRDYEGRFEVSLPWIEGHTDIPSNRSVAERRLKSTVQELKATGNLNAYEAVLNEWLKEEIIEKVPEHEINNFGHYLPHRAVIRMNSTTKIRPVFDGSSKLRNSPSLNECLEKGPNLVELIPAVINRFRKENIGVISDIRKAFLQIGLNVKDRDFLRFLWWNEANPKHLEVYRHRRVVFGVSSSPFLLGASLSYLLEEAPEHIQETAKKLKESWYVDNCVTSVNDEKELKAFKTESVELLSSAKFDLRGWTYNHLPTSHATETSTVIAESLTEQETKYEDENKYVPVLGLQWNLGTDTLSCDLRGLNITSNESITKRHILSTAHRVFDPIGFTCPVTLIPKLLLQDCWKSKISWDSELPPEIYTKFCKWRDQLVILKELSIPRLLKEVYMSHGDMSLHVFCDASKVSYATGIFLRVDHGSRITCQLVQAKSRVAPLKDISIPRLELLACCIGARLADTVKKDLHFELLPTFYWTDSTNALHWIKNEENWGTFVQNRVKEIRSLSNTLDWYYVPGLLNPADLPSRGCTAQTLLRSRWWEGPTWLKQPPEFWPKCDVFSDPGIIDSEKRKTIVSAVNNSESSKDMFENISSFSKIIRVTAWILRFYNNCKSQISSRIRGDLSTDEMKKAELNLLKYVQRQAFPKGVNDIIRNLQPIIDEEGILRLKTRILMRKDKKDFRFPIVLPSEHNIVTKLITWKHIELGHGGVQILMNDLREKYWILRSRKKIRQVVLKCVRCRRFTVQPAQVDSTFLPADRVRDAAIFEITGIDLTGHLILRGGVKAWIVLFTCAVYRAVHLELITSLSKEAFLQALRRFVARRGRPSIIYSDNGSNLSGVSTALRKIKWQEVTGDTTLKSITWKFIPPTAPWWGGWWERLIGLMKQILRKVLGQASLNYEELNTVLCDAESLLNSRPLTYLSEDIQDLVPLTPAMFLQGIREIGVPDLDHVDKTNIRKRYSYLQKLREDLRKRFRIEYLGQLRQSSKLVEQTKISVGEIVLIGSDNMKRLAWPLARIVEVFPGKDGIIRVVRVKSRSGEYLRPVQRLYPLELCEPDRPFLRTKIDTLCKKRRQQNVPENPTEDTPMLMEETIKTLSKQPVTTKSGRKVKPVIRMNL